jgi:hypothetical protein
MKTFYEIYGLSEGNNELSAASPTPTTGQQSKRYSSYKWLNNMFGGEYNPDKLKHSDYMDMLDDPQIDTAYSLITDMLLSKKFLITPASEDPKDVEISDFVNDVVNNMSISFRQTRSDLYSATLFGFAVCENVYKLDINKKIVLDRMKGIDIRTIWDGLVYNDLGDVETIIQNPRGVRSADPIKIPAEKCTIYSRNPLHGNLYGRSDYKSLYDIEFMKSQIVRILMIFLQKHAAPSVVGIAGETGDVSEMQKNLDEIMEGRANLVFPFGSSATLLETSKNGEAFFSAISYLDNMIFRRLRIGSLILGQGADSSGSLAQSQTHDSILGIILDGTHEELAGILEKGFNKLVDYNFNTSTYPNYEFEAFAEEDLIALLNALQPYGQYALINTNETWFKQLLSMIVEKMTGVKVDLETSTELPVTAIVDNTTPENQPITPIIPVKPDNGIANLNNKVKELLPNG